MAEGTCEMAGRRTVGLVAALLACLLLVLGGQAVADTTTAGMGTTDAGELIGGTTSSYLTGLKRFAAAALWNRMDPIFHNYYEGVPLDKQTYMLPTIAMVQTLDPHLVQPYYIGSWMLINSERYEDGMAMAERGLAENPDSGIMYVNLAQLLSLYADDSDRAVDLGTYVLEHDLQWTDAIEMHNAYASLGSIFRQLGRPDLNEIVQQELEWQAEEYADELDQGDHDHDGDGVPDH